jgi:hypothetical protein
MENMYSVLIAVVSVLGSAAAFRFYEKRALKKETMTLLDTIARIESLN